MPHYSLIFCFWVIRDAICLPVFLSKNVLFYGHIKSPVAEKRTWASIINKYYQGEIYFARRLFYRFFLDKNSFFVYSII